MRVPPAKRYAVEEERTKNRSWMAALSQKGTSASFAPKGCFLKEGKHMQLNVQPAGIYRFSVGTFTCMVVNDVEGSAAFPARAYGVNVSAEQMEQALSLHGYPGKELPFQLSVLFIDTGERKILVDTGNGVTPEEANGQWASGIIRHNLQAAGIDPTTIDTILISHVHDDHVGGILDEHGQLAFPNAHYVLSQTSRDYWFSSPLLEKLPQHIQQQMIPAMRDVLTRVESRLIFAEPGQEILPGITALDAPGHMPGHFAFVIASQGEQLLLVNDALVHHLISVEHPDWHFLMDTNPEQAVQTRRLLLSRAGDTGALVFGCHFNWPGLGHIRQQDGHWVWEPIAYRWQ